MAVKICTTCCARATSNEKRPGMVCFLRVNCVLLAVSALLDRCTAVLRSAGEVFTCSPRKGTFHYVVFSDVFIVLPGPFLLSALSIPEAGKENYDLYHLSVVTQATSRL